jgi:hypothetical protein
LHQLLAFTLCLDYFQFGTFQCESRILNKAIHILKF